MPNKHIYTERLSSNKTTALFLALTFIFGLLFIWRLNAAGLGALSIIFGFLALVFFLYVVNYRTLVIYITPQALKLKFGIFSWVVPLDNIAGYRLDEVPTIKRLGGAGIHFMFVDGRYRASFNFLEYPRVVVTFERKAGPVRDISFSTRRPDDVLQSIQKARANTS